MKICLIEIKNLKAKTILGAYEHERKKSQKILINIKFEYNATKPINTDDINDAIDYASLSKKIIQQVKKSSFILLEKLTARIVDLVMQDTRIYSCSVTVTKIKPLDYIEDVSCTLKKGENYEKKFL